MRSLIFHVNEYRAKPVEASTRPKGIVPDTKGEEEHFEEGLLVYVCVEDKDTINETNLLYEEIKKAAKDVGTNNIMISPFVHLSKKIANYKKAKEYLGDLVQKVKTFGFETDTAHFGYHKETLIDIKGHRGSFRYREF
tara:strand:+ start:943 stop:1356 length:414 start_codon:yes stop_codon:yes gene_type:complete